MSPFHKQIKV